MSHSEFSQLNAWKDWETKAAGERCLHMKAASPYTDSTGCRQSRCEPRLSLGSAWLSDGEGGQHGLAEEQRSRGPQVGPPRMGAVCSQQCSRTFASSRQHLTSPGGLRKAQRSRWEWNFQGGMNVSVEVGPGPNNYTRCHPDDSTHSNSTHIDKCV